LAKDQLIGYNNRKEQLKFAWLIGTIVRNVRKKDETGGQR